MKIEITEKGVYDGDGNQIEVGTQLDLQGDDVPAWLVNKGQIVADSKGKTLIVNPSAAERQARLKEIALALGDDDFIGSGAPDVAKVNELLDEGETAFTAAERDQIWSGIADDVTAERKAD